MEQLPPTQQERLQRSNQLIKMARRGEHIDVASLNPLDTSPETVGYIRIIQSGRLALDSAEVTLE